MLEEAIQTPIESRNRGEDLLLINARSYLVCFLLRKTDNPGDVEFVQYDYATLRAATKDFSNENMLGEGGFGVVYKVIHHLLFSFTFYIVTIHNLLNVCWIILQK